MNEPTKKPFGGIERLYGHDAAALLSNSSMAIIGIGGVGSWVAESLARTGIGKLRLIDLDDLCITNINRQVHALTTTAGESKAYIMAQRIKTINPDCQVDILDEFVDTSNIEECLSGSLDYVIEAIDAAVVKAAIIAWCKRRKLPIVCIGGAGGKIDPRQVTISDISKTWNDPLLAKVRSQLRSYHGYSRNLKKSYGIDCVYSPEQPKYPDGQGGVTQDKPDMAGGLDCSSGFGSATHITATFAQFAVARAIEKTLSKLNK